MARLLHPLHPSLFSRSRCPGALRAHVTGPETLLGRAIDRAVQPVPLRRHVEPPRTARRRDAVVERHRDGACAGPGPLRGADRRRRWRCSLLTAGQRYPRRAKCPPRTAPTPSSCADAFRERLHTAADALDGRPHSAFGHPGAGGSLGFADPRLGIGFGYAMNQMQLGLAGDPRAERLVSAAFASLAAVATVTRITAR